MVAAAAFVVGGVLVLSSMWALGITGTYLGDYFVRSLTTTNLLRFCCTNSCAA